jgi:hypothetical protein
VTVTRGTTNGNVRGSSYSRRRRREWLIENYRADVDLLVRYGEGGTERVGQVVAEYPATEVALRQAAEVAELWGPAHFETLPACRCYRCGTLLTVETVTVDRIIPGAAGGTYRRTNIRPACGRCNSETGGALGALLQPGRSRRLAGMEPVERSLRIRKGASWTRAYRLTTGGQPLIDSSWEARAQVRADYDAAAVLHEWSTAAGTITVEDDGTIFLTVEPAVSTAWQWEIGVWDLEASKAGVTYPLLAGTVIAEPEVTR